jgi:hypothetical protein
MRTSICIIGTIAVALLACGGEADKEAKTGDDQAVPAGPGEALLEAWKQGGLEPSAMTPATVSFGKECRSGTVSGVEVLLCQYGSSDDAKQAEPKTAEWTKGAVTAATIVSGPVLVAIADRRKADPSGRTINQMMKLAPK